MRTPALMSLLVLGLVTLSCSASESVEELRECQARADEREAAAELCEDLFDAERVRLTNLEVLLATSIPAQALHEPVLDETFEETLPPSVQADIALQLDRYRATVAAEIGALSDANSRLRQELRRSESQLKSQERKHQADLNKAHDEFRRELDALTSQAGGEAQSLSARLRKADEERRRAINALSRISAEVRTLIGELEDFETKSVTCRGCKWRDRNRRTLRAFHSQLIKKALALQSMTEVR